MRRLRTYRVLLYFLLGLLALDLLIVAHRDSWRAYDPDDYRERLEGCLARHQDLVIVGGSPVSEGIDPKELVDLSWNGRPLHQVFNLGLPGATTTEVWHAVEHGLTTPPDVLVYGITASDLNDARLEPHGVQSLMDLNDFKEFVRSRPESRAWMVRHYAEERVGGVWQLYFYRNAVRLWAADQFAQIAPDAFPKPTAEAQTHLRRFADLQADNGFAPQSDLRAARLDERRPTGVLGKRFPFLENYRLGGHLGYLHRLLDWAEKNGVAVVLVDMPVPADLDEQMHVRAFQEYRAALQEVARRRNVPLLSANRKATGIDDSDFADRIHLNAEGTRKLSGWLREQLSVCESGAH